VANERSATVGRTSSRLEVDDLETTSRPPAYQRHSTVLQRDSGVLCRGGHGWAVQLRLRVCLFSLLAVKGKRLKLSAPKSVEIIWFMADPQHALTLRAKSQSRG